MAGLMVPSDQYGGGTLVVLAVIGAALIIVGLGIALNYRNLAARTATFMTGRPEENPMRLPVSIDRLWSILPLSMGLTSVALLLEAFNQPVPRQFFPAMAGTYVVTTFGLAWPYGGIQFRNWRAAAIPVIAFLAFGVIVSVSVAVFQ